MTTSHPIDNCTPENQFCYYCGWHFFEINFHAVFQMNYICSHFSIPSFLGSKSKLVLLLMNCFSWSGHLEKFPNTLKLGLQTIMTIIVITYPNVCSHYEGGTQWKFYNDTKLFGVGKEKHLTKMKWETQTYPCDFTTEVV